MTEIRVSDDLSRVHVSKLLPVQQTNAVLLVVVKTVAFCVRETKQTALMEMDSSCSLKLFREFCALLCLVVEH